MGLEFHFKGVLLGTRVMLSKHLAERGPLKIGGLLVSTWCLDYNVALLLFLGNGCTFLKFCHYNNSSSLQDSAKVSSTYEGK